MCQRGAEGRDAIQACFAELEAAGYLVRERWRDATTGRWCSKNRFYASSQVATITDFQDRSARTGDPGVERPGETGYPAGHAQSWKSGAGEPGPVGQDLYEVQKEEQNEGLPSSSATGTGPVGGDADDAGPEASAKIDLDAGRVSKPVREDVERLCVHLADSIESNGSKRPPINKGWRDSARLLMDRDGRTEEQIIAAIDWCQADEFWRTNILSMPKLREKYDQLRLVAQRQMRSSNGASPQRRSTRDERVMQALEAGERLQAMVNGHTRKEIGP
jgi:hypothetical protein